MFEINKLVCASRQDVWILLDNCAGRFYPRDAMRKAGYSCRNVSGCLSGRLSVTAGIVSKWRELAS